MNQPQHGTTSDDLPPLADITTGTIAIEDAVLTLAGDVDTLLVSAWRREHPEIPRVSAIRAGGVTFMGSAAVAYIIALCKAAGEERIELAEASRPALRPLQVMGVDRLMRTR